MFTDDDETIKLIDEMESIKMAESPLPPPKKKKRKMKWWKKWNRWKNNDIKTWRETDEKMNLYSFSFECAF